MTFQHKTNPYATHQPVLMELYRQRLSGNDKPILELGCGEGSSVLLHELCEKSGRLIVTADDNLDWLNKYRDRLRTSWHRFVHMPVIEFQMNGGTAKLADAHWAMLYAALAGLYDDWAFVFIDNSPWSARTRALKTFVDHADFVMVHDCDYFPTNGIFGKVVRPIVEFKDPGERTYGDVFKYWREYMPPVPWPGPTGPPTLLGSNRLDAMPEVDFSKYS